MKTKAIWIALIFLGFNATLTLSQTIYSEDIASSLEDLDRDGVINARDVCENTRIGTKVENNGCPIIYLKYFHFNFDVQFDTNEYQLPSEFYSTLEGLAQFLLDYPETLVIIEGYTDNKGSSTYNQVLSEKRALSIAKTLTAIFGIHSNRIKTFGFGQENPLASNDTEEGRKQNRRVTGEIIQPTRPPHTNQLPENRPTFSIPFALNQYAIQTTFQSNIETLGKFLQENPESFALIEGHTDNTGNEHLNLDLSKKRAHDLAEAISIEFSISKSRLKVIGYGEQNPIAANDTPEGRQQNRRVDITIGNRFKAQKEVFLPKWTIWNLGQDDIDSTKS